MATTVGTEDNLVDLLSDLVQLDYDAADAYQAAIDRLEDTAARSSLVAFRQDRSNATWRMSGVTANGYCRGSADRRGCRYA